MLLKASPFPSALSVFLIKYTVGECNREVWTWIWSGGALGNLTGIHTCDG